MSLAVMLLPHSVCVEWATSWIRLFPESAMYSWVLFAQTTDVGPVRNADVAGPRFPDVPAVPFTFPATVYRSLAVIVMPHWLPPLLAASTTRLLPVSAIYRSPAELVPIPSGVVSREDPKAVPLPDRPADPRLSPATVYMSQAVMDWFH